MPIDYFFRSVALECPGNCIGVVLSGTGSDGSLGTVEIKSAGGITFAQDKDSAGHDGMPRAAVATGDVDYVFAPEAIAHELKRIARHPYTDGKQIAQLSQEALLQRIFTMLRNRTSVDFKHYKQNTVKRRIFRRMALLKIETLDDYIRVLSNTPNELDTLYQDMLIKVTCFFREANAFKVLSDRVFPAIVRNRVRQEPIRIWVPGCSSGEEVYSLAIALLEYLGDNAGSTPIQIFGTDVSNTALEKARSGIYIENIALDVSPGRLRRWFVRVDRGYQISKDIRDMCIFAKQNLTSDPPFSKIDLISCRNLLIYLDLIFQTRVMPVFHYALKTNGFLMLGNSESIGSHSELFSPVDKRAKIYAKKLTDRLPGVSFSRSPQEDPREGRPPAAEQRQAPDIQQAADHFIVSRFAPVGVIVDNDFKIIQFRGSTGDYLEPAPGHATFHLIKMARGNLGMELRSLIQEARSTGHPVRKEGVRFQVRQELVRNITLEVAPIRTDGASGYHFLILFEESASPPPAEAAAPAPPPHEKRHGQSTEVAELKQELTATKAYLQSTIEESEATNEELKSANEEIMSSNEELQSTNEELETAKEELQSTNEELTTVNEEVQIRNAELSLLNSDLNNFLGSVNVPVVMLGTDLRIRRFTPTTQRVFNLIPTDIGRPFGDIRPKVNVPHLNRLIAQVIDTITVHEQEVADDKGRYYHMSIRPYRTPENKIDGAMLIFSDIDSIKRASLLLEESKTYAEAIIEAVFDPLLVLDADFVIQRANSAYYRLFETDARQTENRSLFALDRSQWDIPAIRHLLAAAFKSRRKMHSVEITERFSRIGERSLLINARPIARRDSEAPLILLTMVDLTARKQAEEEKASLGRQLTKERALFEAVLRQIGMGVAIFEAPSGKLLLANDNLRSLLPGKLPNSADIAAFRKIRVAQVTAGDNETSGWPMERSLRKGEVVPYEEVTLAQRGTDRVVLQISSSPVYDAQKQMIAVVALFLNITERKQIKEQIVDISSREQRRIAHDLHDGLGQELAAIVYRTKALKSRLTRARATEADEAGKIAALAEAALGRTRDLVKFVQPVAMDARGLMQSLKDLAQSSSRLYDVECTFVCPHAVPIANQDIALHVFRIAQEAVHNGVKHGKPRRILIGLRKRRNLAELTISNDGHDFKPPRSAGKRGLGLHIMGYRANVLQGDLTITRQRPRGTLVKCIFKTNAIL
jgi:two-component system CheB/CheR fusion protein